MASKYNKDSGKMKLSTPKKSGGRKTAATSPFQKFFKEKSSSKLDDLAPKDKKFWGKDFEDDKKPRTPSSRPGDRPAFGDRKPSDRPAFGDRKPNDKPAFGERTFSRERPSFTDREKPNFGDRRAGPSSFGEKKFGERSDEGRFSKTTFSSDRFDSKPSFKSNRNDDKFEEKPRSFDRRDDRRRDDDKRRDHDHNEDNQPKRRLFSDDYFLGGNNDRPYGHIEKKSDKKFDSFNDKSDDKKSFAKKFDDRRVDAPYIEPRDARDSRKPEKHVEAEIIRLNKFVAQSGLCSRRKAAELVKDGEISVNGKVEANPAYETQESDIITYKGNVLKKEERMYYILMNKPKNFITTAEDEKGRKTVLDLIGDRYPARLFPIGRLDRNTTGLLLLTNDGDLAKKLSHPSHQVKKVYTVETDINVKTSDLDKIKAGIMLDDGVAEVDAVDYIDGGKKNEVGIEIHSGKNRIVRRIFESLGYEVVKLDRTYYAGLTKKDLPRSFTRELNEKEIIMLKHFTNNRKKEE